MYAENADEYISLTDIARFRDAERSDYILQNWMRNRSTIEIIGLWEIFNNPDFNSSEFDGIKNMSGSNSFALTLKRWIESTNAKGIVSKIVCCWGLKQYKLILITSQMQIFETDRFVINSFEQRDEIFFIELLSDPEIINPVPQPELSINIIAEKFNSNLNYNGNPQKYKDNIWGVFEKFNNEMIGLCALLTNDENDWELAYRFRTKYWGKGYGTETTKGLIDYCFLKLNIDKITADVNIENKASVTILSKFMKPVIEFFNEKDNCTDRRYQIENF